MMLGSQAALHLFATPCSVKGWTVADAGGNQIISEGGSELVQETARALTNRGEAADTIVHLTSMGDVVYRGPLSSMAMHG
jgi:hypothetical protein